MEDDDLLEHMRAAFNAGQFGNGVPMHEHVEYSEHGEDIAGEEEAATHDSVIDPADPEDFNIPTEPSLHVASTTSSQRRRRGSRGGTSNRSGRDGRAASEKRWRSGEVPTPPCFDGDIDSDPYCLRHYRRKLWRWVRITKEFLPPNEQALRAREQLRGEAEIEFEEVDDSRFDCENGIQVLLDDLEVSFGEKELFRQGGVIREFESIGRLQGESVHAFVRRFRLTERKLQDNRVHQYPEEARVIKLLDGLRLDERSTASLLLAAGNQYKMQLILDAIRIQYPAGMSITGLPLGSKDKHKGRGRGQRKWSNWHAAASDYEAEYDQVPEEYEATDYEEATAYEVGQDYDPDAAWDDVEYDEEDYNASGDHAVQFSEPASAEPSVASTLAECVEALTVTSRRLAEMTKARGFFQTNDKKGDSKGKSKSKGSNPKGKSKGKGKNGPSSSQKGKSKGKGRGKPSPTPSKANLTAQQQRWLADAACLGCGSTKHWLEDCPMHSKHSAQLVSSGLTLDADGEVQSWTVSSEVKSDCVCLPALTTNLDVALVETPQVVWSPPKDDGPLVFPIPSNPRVLLQYAGSDAALMIADTGCQRQVAGSSWHLNRQRDVHPLQVQTCPENCKFSFGPNEGIPSNQRFIYPAGIGGAVVSLGVSLVDVEAPALFSRPSFAALGAVPNIVTGTMFYQALNTESKLFLSPCGHLAIRLDEWPSEKFAWPLSGAPKPHPDAWAGNAAVLDPVRLVTTYAPSRPPPHAEQCSTMAAALEDNAPAPDGVHIQHDDDCGALCSSEHAPQSEGQGAQIVLPCASGHNSSHHSGSFDSASRQRKLSPSTRDMHTSPRTSQLRSRGKTNSNLRCVRFAVDCERQGDAESSAKGQSNSSDAFALKSQQSKGKGKGNEFSELSANPGNGCRMAWLSTLLTAFLTALLYGNSSKPIEGSWCNGQECSFDGTSHARDLQQECCRFDRGGDPFVEPPLRGPADFPCSDVRVRRGKRRDQCGGSAGSGRPLGGGDMEFLGGGRCGDGGSRLCLSTPTMKSSSSLTRPSDEELGACAWSSFSMASAQSMTAASSITMGTFSTDHPMRHEDLGSYVLKRGTQKRLLGNSRQTYELLKAEADIYEARVRQARALRRFKFDIVEIYAGMGNITAEALQQGLRALQPVDAVHGIRLDRRSDHVRLRQLLHERLPFLVVWEIRCDPWSNINHLNFSAEELEQLREEQRLSIHEMAETIKELQQAGVHFLLENPWNTPFWQHDDILSILRLPGVELRMGSICRFGLRGRDGWLIRKHTGWASDLPQILDQIAIPCSGSHHQEPCLGGNSKRAQVYTRQLALAVICGLMHALRDFGDERFLPSTSTAWTRGFDVSSPLDLHSCHDQDVWNQMWIAAADTLRNFEVLYVDIIRDVDSWRPLLVEAQKRLEGKVASSAIIKTGTGFFEQVQALVPWTIHQAQIVRAPKVRRAPYQLLTQHPISHRAAVLWQNDGRIIFETEEMKSVAGASGSKFSTPVNFAILIYGEAPQTSLNPEDDSKPDEPLSKSTEDAMIKDLQPEEQLQAWQPGHKDITFDVSDDLVPKWVKNVLRRVHTNLGHPSQQALVRYLAQAGASSAALQGAKHLKCAVCERTKPPQQARPAKAIQSRRFNDRLFMDIVFLRNINGETFPYLNLLDDASTYQVLEPLFQK